MRPFLIALTVTAALASASAAGAFTLEPGGASAAQRFQLRDPDAGGQTFLAAPENGRTSSMTLFKSGSSSLSFGLRRQDDGAGGLWRQPTPFGHMGMSPFRSLPGDPN